MKEIMMWDNKNRIIKESDTRYILEEYVWFWIFWYWQRGQIFREGLGRGYFSYESEKEVRDAGWRL